MNSLHSYGIRLESIDLKKLPRWICCLGLWDRHLCLRFIVKMPANRWYHYFKVIVQTCATWWYSTAVLVEKIRRAICRNLKAGTHLRYHTITVEVCSKFFNYCLRASLAIWSPSLDDGWHHEILADLTCGKNLVSPGSYTYVFSFAWISENNLPMNCVPLRCLQIIDYMWVCQFQLLRTFKLPID